MRALHSLRACLGIALTVFSILANAGPAEETARLHQWLDVRYEEELGMSPTRLTRLGRKEKYDQVDDFSRDAEEAYLQWIAESGKTLVAEFDYEDLTEEGKVSYDFWMYRVADSAAWAPFRDHEYVMTTWSEAHTAPLNFMLNMHEVSTESDMAAYVARVEAWGRALEQLQDRVEFAAEKGIRPPRFSYEDVIRQSRLIVEDMFFGASESASGIWGDAKQKIAALEQQGVIDEARASRFLEGTRRALMGSLLPAYQRILRWHEADIENADKQAQGVHALPQGKAYFEYRLGHYTQSAMSPAEVHQLGLKEVARILAEMEAIRVQIGFEGDLQEFFTYVREDDRFYYAGDQAGRSKYIEQTRGYLDFIDQKLPEYFGRLPKATLEVKRVESYREVDGGAAFYSDSTPDGSRPGVYYLHMSDMRAMNITDMETTAYHEGSPGHHMQSAIALENEDMPMFRRDVWYSAYGEGWALYSEALAKEMGAFKEPYMDFGRLINEQWRAMRLVVDSGLHAMQWSEQQAVDYFMENAPMPETTARAEIQRYLLSPGQASSYKAGMLRIQAMRARAEDALGAKFDIRDFHDMYLAGGSVPLPVLEKRLDSWIAAQR